MSPKALVALRVLQQNPAGLYGSDVVRLSGGAIGMGTVYSVLDRLVEQDMVREVDEAPTPDMGLGRTRHFITRTGLRAIEAADIGQAHPVSARAIAT